METFAKDKIKVLGVSSNFLVRRGFLSGLSSEHDIEVLCEGSNRLELLDCIGKVKLDVIVVSEISNFSDCLETINLIKQEDFYLKVILVIHQKDLEKELFALKLGVKGIVPGSSSNSNFLRCIRSVNKGRLWIRRKVLERYISQLSILNGLNGNGIDEFALPAFSQRERQIMFLVGKDYKNKEIGQSLFISEKTVKHYLSKVFKKLKVRKRSEVKQYLRLSI